MSDDELRVAVVGYGLSGSMFHAPLIAITPGMRLVSVVTSNQARRASAEADNPGIRVYRDLNQLLSMAPEHDLVVVTSPTGTHLAVSLAVIDAGLPLVVDKPLAATGPEARQILTAARARGVLLTVFHNRRWDGDTLTLQRLLGGGALGAAVRFESRFERYRPDVRQDAWREQVPAEQGGGLLLDLGSHIVDQALHLFGPAAGVYAEVRAVRAEAVADDDVFVAIEHAGGVRSHVWASSVAATPGPRIRLLGLAGGYEKTDLDIQEEQLRAGTRPDDPGWGVEAPERWGRLVTADGERPVETARGEWPRFYQLLGDALRTGSAPPVSPESAVAVNELLDAARVSARSREVVRLLATG